MLALLFEVMPKPGHTEHYFRHVDILKPVLAKHTGMVWLDRYRSLSRDNLILSHQLWEDDAAITRWREDKVHQGSQSAGRNKHFQDYRIRIAEVFARVDKGEEMQRFATGADASGDYLIVGHSRDEALLELGESFASVNIPGNFAGISQAADEDQALEALSSIAEKPAMTWAFAARMTRDYGMYERAQAPQDYPAIERTD